ncbi:hypothetical protein NUW54_g10825 [Trametes sanguinea]|uniref:Uncharacterized protein n=1 Tax=Trametes sanguinea TaxID=158606 RepID=A0ACC1NRQ6_9APHY|nr:hypothetical protein NUW54_g10825 [Trametes sanguinea]
MHPNSHRRPSDSALCHGPSLIRDPATVVTCTATRPLSFLLALSGSSRLPSLVASLSSSGLRPSELDYSMNKNTVSRAKFSHSAVCSTQLQYRTRMRFLVPNSSIGRPHITHPPFRPLFNSA